MLSNGWLRFRSLQLPQRADWHTHRGCASVLLTPNLRFLFAVNAGGNSVSSFGVGEDGTLALLDVKRTGNIVTGRGGTAKSLAYAPSSGTLYVLSSGPTPMSPSKRGLRRIRRRPLERDHEPLFRTTAHRA